MKNTVWWLFAAVLGVILVVLGVTARRAQAPSELPSPTPAVQPPAGPPAAGSPTPTPAQDAELEVSVKSTDYAFEPATLTANAGQNVVVHIENAGFHTFTIDGVVNAILSGPTSTVRFPAPVQPGSYEVYCAIPGHKQRGMVGTLVVK